MLEDTLQFVHLKLTVLNYLDKEKCQKKQLIMNKAFVFVMHKVKQKAQFFLNAVVSSVLQLLTPG